MSGFSAEWLALREPFDRCARNPTVRDAVTSSFKDHFSVRVVDLASGTGSTLRALSPHFPPRQDWRLIDNDLGLLARANAPEFAGITMKAVPVDLTIDLELVLDGPVDLVTASALLDLVSSSWLDRLATEMAARAIPLYAALNYDGRLELTPTDPFDTAIVNALNTHQCTDKGFGPALGPAAPIQAIARLEALGYSVMHGSSDWLIGPAAHAIQNQILSGLAGAACEMGESLPETASWLSRREKLVAADQSSIRVGHIDLWARQTGTR